MRIDKNTTIKLGDRNIVKIKIGDSIIWEKNIVVDETNYFYIENTYAGTNTISVKQTIVGSPDSSTYAKNLQYSKDKTNWSTITLSSTTYNINLNQGERVYFRGNEGVLNYYANDGAIQAITNILGTQTHTIGGNINTLVNYITPNELTLTQGVFAELFQNNTTITSAETLTLPPSSDDSLPTFAYYLMFSGCSALITPPSEIPATKQGHASCSKMFLDCVQLKTPPALKSTILGNYCYQALFKGCSALTTPPTIIPAKTAPYLSCHRMFNDCVSLQSGPELPATTVGSGAYQYMFMGCSNLQTAPSELPAETLTLNSYYEMFRDCSQLTTAPTIKAKTFAENSCRAMFLNCSKLNNVTVYANDISASNCTTNWLKNVASSGTFNNMGDATYTKDSVSGIPTGWTEVKPDYLYVENTYAGENTITFTTTQSGTPASGTYATSVEYSKDKLTWNTLTFNTSTPQTITVGVGEKLYLRNDTGVFNFHDVRNGNVDYYTSITSTNTINIGGNTNSLFDYTNMSGVDVSSTVGGLCRLFNQSVNLVNAKDIVIPQTTYPDFFLDEMFNRCESLVTTPNLNNVVNIGYASCSQMFGYCYSLVTPPDFNSVTYTGIRGGFSWCFYDCTSLTRTPSFNSLTSIGPLGFNKSFMNCSNLKDIMFDTSSITNLPESAFNQSFTNTKIETGLHLGNVTELGKSSLYKLYNNCSFLSVVYCPNVSSWDESITRNWLSGAGTSVSGTKTAYKYSNISIPTSDSGIPSGWTVVEPDYLYVENTYAGENTISVKQTITGEPDSSTYAKTLQYSKDKTNWSTITLSSTTYNINLNQGERVYFRGNEGVLNYYSNDATIQAITNIFGAQTHNIGGNINTLVNYITPNELTLTQGVFALLFQNNTTITSGENLTLPATEMAEGCYRGLFYGCTSLTSMPELPATELAPNCYRAMLANCTSLTTSTKLPATKLSIDCYRELFFKCSSLVNPPELPAEILTEGCYRTLFFKCSKLNNVTVYADDISATDCTTNWLSGVASSGTFNNYGSATYTTNSPSGIPTGWTEVKPNEPNYFYVENTYNGNNNIYVKTRASYKNTEPTGEFATTLEYSKDKTNWTTINLNYDYHKNGSTVVSNLVTNLTLSLSAGEKVYFRNTSGYFGYVDSGIGTHSHQFSSDENIKVGGNIKSLLDYRDMVGTTMKKGCFYEMFFEANKLTDASELILPDTVAESCFLGLFSGCSSLTSIPSLPALTMAPSCYCEMLKNTAITTPPALPATKLAPYCYRNLFENCYSLTSSPELPATTMVEGCYQGLFNSCNHLTTAPVLSAKTLAKYSYRYMFNGCLRLNSVTTYADNIGAEECTRWWLESVASSGTFRNLGSATYVTDSGDGIPTGWTEVKS